MDYITDPKKYIPSLIAIFGIGLAVMAEDIVPENPTVYAAGLGITGLGLSGLAGNYRDNLEDLFYRN